MVATDFEVPFYLWWISMIWGFWFSIWEFGYLIYFLCSDFGLGFSMRGKGEEKDGKQWIWIYGFVFLDFGFWWFLGFGLRDDGHVFGVLDYEFSGFGFVFLDFGCWFLAIVEHDLGIGNNVSGIAF
jgi:hypothetical protein